MQADECLIWSCSLQNNVFLQVLRAKVQISMCLSALWSEPFLSPWIKLLVPWLSKERTFIAYHTAQTHSISSLVRHPQRQPLFWNGSHIEQHCDNVVLWLLHKKGVICYHDIRKKSFLHMKTAETVDHCINVFYETAELLRLFVWCIWAVPWGKLSMECSGLQNLEFAAHLAYVIGQLLLTQGQQL